jgi:ABC-type transport system involved in cytochrome c biogenesis permease component
MPDTPGAPKLPAGGLLLAAQIRYQVRLLLANGRTAAICIGLPVILLVTSGISHGHATAAAVASPATFGLTLAAWNAGGVRLVAAREAGVLKRWRASPLPRWCYFLGRIIATLAVGTLAGTVTVAVGVCFYHVHLTAGAALVILVVFALGAAAWAASATALSSAIPTVEAAFPILILIYFPVLIVSWPPRLHQRTPLAHHPRQLPSCSTACRRRHQRPPPRQRHPAIPRARPPDPRRLGRRRPRRRHHHVPMGTAPSDPTSSRPSNASKRRVKSANGTHGTRYSAPGELSVDSNAMKCTFPYANRGGHPSIPRRRVASCARSFSTDPVRFYRPSLKVTRA